MKIDKGIPMPNSHFNGKTSMLVNLTVGDSFLVTGAPDEKQRWRNIIKQVQQTRGGRFATRTVEDGMRIWRTK